MKSEHLRQSYLLANFGFSCSCQLCALEGEAREQVTNQDLDLDLGGDQDQPRPRQVSLEQEASGLLKLTNQDLTPLSPSLKIIDIRMKWKWKWYFDMVIMMTLYLCRTMR